MCIRSQWKVYIYKSCSGMEPVTLCRVSLNRPYGNFRCIYTSSSLATLQSLLLLAGIRRMYSGLLECDGLSLGLSSATFRNNMSPSCARIKGCRASSCSPLLLQTKGLRSYRNVGSSWPSDTDTSQQNLHCQLRALLWRHVLQICTALSDLVGFCFVACGFICGVGL